jgi:hypothetical protein
MQLTILDKSNYLKGLLILIGKDKKITEDERAVLLKLSDVLGFNRQFCDDAMNELFENEYIIEEPPLFSHLEIAKAFYKDCMRMASVDKEIHLHEMNWIKATAERNNIPPEWRAEVFEQATTIHSSDSKFEICKLLETKE